MTVSVVIPAHNEEANIANTLRGVLAAVEGPREIIVVADHCTDRTEEIVREIAAQHPEVRLLTNADRPRGFGNTVITGLKAAAGDCVVPVMADSCDDPTTINRMRATLMEGKWDVVCASRYMRGGGKSGGPMLQNILSRSVCYTLRIIARIPTWDAANSYKMYRTAFLRTLEFDVPGAGTEYSLALLLRAWRAGGTITEISTAWHGKPIPVSREWRILKRFPGYWQWYRKAMTRSRN